MSQEKDSRQYIKIRGANEHNLKNIDVDIPRDKLVVLTGLSGSGKSSLAFDTIYAEGQRRYMESLSSYARQFLGQMEKPDVDSIEGLSPAISIDQKTTSKNPRSTVGTITEIYDYLRLLYARVGIPHCPVCGVEIKQQALDSIVDKIMKLDEGTRIQILAPVIRGRKGEYAKLFEDYRKSGYVRVRVDGIIYDLGEDIPLDKNKKHNIEVVVDRLVIREDIKMRLVGSCETASKLSNGLIVISVPDGEETTYSQRYSCPEHGIGIEELTPRMFSFNNPAGACKTCSGLGFTMAVDPDLVIPNKEIKEVFKLQIQEWFRNKIFSNTEQLQDFWKAFKDGNTQIMEMYLNKVLSNSVSVFDTRARNDEKESSYHNLLVGILTGNADWLVKSNVEAGEGFADIIVETDDPDEGIIAELKYTKDFKAMEKSCEKALKQIKDRRYQEYLLNDDRQNIMYYGITFCRKRCKVLVEGYNGDSEPDKA